MKADKSTLAFCFSKRKLLFCFVQTLQPKGLDMLDTHDPEMKHLAQCSFLCCRERG